MIVKRPYRSGRWAAACGTATMWVGVTRGVTTSIANATAHSQNRTGVGTSADMSQSDAATAQLAAIRVVKARAHRMCRTRKYCVTRTRRIIEYAAAKPAESRLSRAPVELNAITATRNI